VLEAKEAKAMALCEHNEERLALLSREQQAVARQGATERFREDRDWRAAGCNPLRILRQHSRLNRRLDPSDLRPWKRH